MWRSVTCLLGLLLAPFPTSVAHWSTQTNSHDSLRGPQREEEDPPRHHVIRRIYGPENAKARYEISLVEEKMERARTGIPGDPNHWIEYENHPFDKRGRKLQDDGEEKENLFKPMRIRFETQALDDKRDSSNAAQIDFIKSQILPRMANYWSEALAVVPVQGNLFISTAELDNREFCGDSEFTRVPNDHVSKGIPNTDVVLYISGTPSSRFCSGSTLAVAVACNFDQYDRPIAGSINFCLDQISLRSDGTASASVIQDNVDVAIHEAAHVLGMSSNSYRYFWDSETGEPRTPRPFSTSSVTCVDGRTRSLIMPAENTMKFFLASNGQRYASIVTPKVRTVARNQFDCQSLAGAQLENQPTGSQSCTGDHWDERLFYPEALSGVISPTTNILSHLTLALMEDSGWYKANYTMGRNSPWGHGLGCSFVTDACLVDDGGGNPKVPDYGRGSFCNVGSKRGCSPALTHKLACTVIDYDYILPQRLPERQFQYFSNDPTKGGPRQADYCPVFGSTYEGKSAEELDCTIENNEPAVNWFSESYGTESKCYETDSGEGRCYRSACIKSEMVLKINVRGEWFPCEYDFQVIDVRVGTAGAVPQKITCPRLSTACPDLFCPFNCAGRGVCNFANTVNGTVHPKCECFDTTDATPGCSDSLVPDGSFLDDSSGLVNKIDESFFDPLVAVFYDHPDKWTTASWAWAAGLLCLFIVMLLCICSTFVPRRERKSVPSPRRSRSPGRVRRGTSF